jgi:hypothetical protein
MLGRKLYKTSMLNIFRLIIWAITIFFFNDFYLETFTYEKFQNVGRFKILDVVEFHYTYPHEFITFFCLIIIPAVYYGLIRGVKFCEKGFIYNRGLPFLNKSVLYEDVKTYKLLHPKKAISIHTHKGDVFVIADNHAERVIAILDQHNIKGDLAQDDYVRLMANYGKFATIVIVFTIVLFVTKKIGLFAFLE